MLTLNKRPASLDTLLAHEATHAIQQTGTYSTDATTFLARPDFGAGLQQTVAEPNTARTSSPADWSDHVTSDPGISLDATAVRATLSPEPVLLDEPAIETAVALPNSEHEFDTRYRAPLHQDDDIGWASLEGNNDLHGISAKDVINTLGTADLFQGFAGQGTLTSGDHMRLPEISPTYHEIELVILGHTELAVIDDGLMIL